MVVCLEVPESSKEEDSIPEVPQPEEEVIPEPTPTEEETLQLEGRLFFLYALNIFLGQKFGHLRPF